ncbi:MAG: hypothetical protein JSR98_01515 [Proteobacteria bacterium]|nr:hypothetical protein [Pseudomonadota bacterium]
MMFLLNDVVLRIEDVPADGRVSGERMQKLSFPDILRMGQELFAEHPKLQKTHPEKAKRLAHLIARKAPIVNAALFVAPREDCEPHEVTVRFVTCEFEVIAELYTQQREGRLDTVRADRAVWKRLAA